MGEAVQAQGDDTIVTGEGEDTVEGGGVDTGEVEIVLEGAEPEGKKAGGRNPVRDMRQRIKRGESDNKALRDENAVLKRRLEEGTPRVEPSTQRPTLAGCQFDTEKYELELEQFMSGNLDKRLDERLGTHRASAEQHTADVANEAAISDHYVRAGKLGVLDYEDAEDAAVESLGMEIVQSIQSRVKGSEKLVYFLGKNPGEAAKIKALFDRDAGTATFELGVLAAKLTIKPKGKKLPDPDIPIDGGGGGIDPRYKEFASKLDKAYDNADINAARAIREEAKAAGVTLPYNTT